MKLENTKNTFRSTIWGMFYKLITMVMPFITRTIIIYVLGIEYAGLGNLFTAILTVLSFAELGISNAVIYMMYKPIAEDNRKEICTLLGLYRRIYHIIGFAILGLGITLSPFLRYLINGSYPETINLYILFFIYLANAAFSYFGFAYKKSILYVCQRRDVESKVSAFVMFGIYITEIIVLLLFKNFYVYAICLPLSTLLINMIVAIEVRHRYPWANCKGTVAKSTVKTLLNNTISLIGHKLGFVATNSEDNIIISSFLGLTAVTLYNNYYYVINAVSGLVGVFYHSILAGIGNSLIKEKKEKNYNDLLNITFINLWLVGWCGICFVCLFQTFILIWMGEGMLLDMPTVVLLTFSFYFMQSRNIVLTYKDAIGIWDKDALKPYVVLAVNLLLNVILVQQIGIKGVVVATLFTSAFIGMPWETIVLHKYYFGVSAKRYFVEYVIYFIITVITGIITWLITELVSFNNLYITLFWKLIICIFLPNTIFVAFSFKTERFKYLWKHLISLGLKNDFEK